MYTDPIQHIIENQCPQWIPGPLDSIIQVSRKYIAGSDWWVISFIIIGALVFAIIFPLTHNIINTALDGFKLIWKKFSNRRGRNELGRGRKKRK